MYQTIDETVEVLGSYLKAGFKPLRFKWRSRVYPVEQVTLVTETKNAGVRGRIYSVVSKSNVYRLYFNRDLETWSLQEVWCE